MKQSTSLAVHFTGRALYWPCSLMGVSSSFEEPQRTAVGRARPHPLEQQGTQAHVRPCLPPLPLHCTFSRARENLSN